MSHDLRTDEDYLLQLPLVSDDQAAGEIDAQRRDMLFDRIVREPHDGQVAAGSRRPLTSRRSLRARRSVVVVVAVAGLLGLAAVGWAVINAMSSTTMAACHTEGDPHSGVGIDLVTGDPVVDCAAIWVQETGEQAPPLAAYDNGTGGIAVLPAEAPVPDGWQPLEAGASTDPRVVELQAALDDHVAGLPSACHDTSSAQQVVGRELERLALEGWSITTDGPDPDGEDTCAYFRIDASQPRVVLYPLDGMEPPDDAPYVRFARALGPAVGERCLTLPDAAQEAIRIAADVGIPPEGLTIHEIVDEDATCTRVHLGVAGAIEVRLRGPADAL